MLLRTSQIGCVAVGLLLAPRALAQTSGTEPLPKESSPAACTTRTTTSTYLTPHAAVDVKDTTLCFDPVKAWMTAANASAINDRADFPVGSSVALTASPSARSSFQSWGGDSIPVPSVGSLILIDASGSMAGHVAVVSQTVTAFAAMLATEGNFEIRIVNFGINQSGIGEGVLPGLHFVFSDLVGSPFFVPADPDVTVQFRKPSVPSGGPPVSGLLHLDQLGRYAAIVTLNGRRLRAITIRPRVAGLFANPPPVHHHVSVRGARGETARVDIDEEQIVPPSLTAGVPADSQCMVLVRRVVTDAVLSASGSVPQAPTLHRSAVRAVVTASLSAPGILPLRI
jgi:hypothetical protein